MQKRMMCIYMLLAFCSIAAVGCGSEEKSQKITEQTADPVQFGNEEDGYKFPYIASDYVTVGEYTGLAVKNVPIRDVSDSDVDAEIKLRIQQNDALLNITSGTVSDGDTINISFTGKISGEEFISKEDYNLRIGSGNLDQAFESELVGKEIGTSIVFNTILSDNFGTNAGKEAVFNVSINSLRKSPELDDQFAASLSGQMYQTAKEYKESVKKDLEETAKNNQQEAIFNEILAEVADDSQFSGYPVIDHTENDIEKEASMLGMTAEQLKQIREEADVNEVENEADAELMINLLIQGIAEKENIIITDDEIDSMYTKLMDYGFTSKEEVDSEFSKEDLARMALKEEVRSFLLDNNSVEKE